jgi:hypothetical protein
VKAAERHYVSGSVKISGRKELKRKVIECSETVCVYDFHCMKQNEWHAQ